MEEADGLSRTQREFIQTDTVSKRIRLTRSEARLGCPPNADRLRNRMLQRVTQHRRRQSVRVSVHTPTMLGLWAASGFFSELPYEYILVAGDMHSVACKHPDPRVEVSSRFS